MTIVLQTQESKHHLISRSAQSSLKTDQSQFLAQWEEDELSAEVIFDERFQIDNDPFHLGEKNGLLKVHSLFSLMGLNHAYVTSMGRSEDTDGEIQCYPGFCPTVGQPIRYVLSLYVDSTTSLPSKHCIEAKARFADG